MTIAIHIDPAPLLHVLDERGWTKGEYNDEQADAPVCLHGAVRLCSPQPGDAHLIEQVATKQGWGTAWNDSNQRTEAEVRDLLAKGINITDADLADTFGPMWLAITQIVRRAATLTPDEAPRLDAARVAARVAARAAARDAARAAAWDAAWAAAGTPLGPPLGPPLGTPLGPPQFGTSPPKTDRSPSPTVTCSWPPLSRCAGCPRRWR